MSAVTMSGTGAEVDAVTEQLRGSGIGMDQVMGAVAPMWAVIWPIVKFLLTLGVPAAIVAGIGWALFLRWSQHGVQGL